MTDAVTRITEDHREMDKLFTQVRSGGRGRNAAFEKVCGMLLAHGHAEEQEVYPEIAKLPGQDKSEVRHGAEEHHEVEQMVQELREMGTGADQFDATFGELVESVQHHVSEEENELLPRLKQGVDHTRLIEIGDAFARRRDAELRRVGQAA